MPYDFVTATGVVVADASGVLAEVEAEYLATFGADLDLDPETPEGILIAAETSSRTGIAANNAQIANQINPALAGGVFLDALWALTGGARDVATSSTFSTPPFVTGTPGLLIPAGSVAATAAGDQFETLGSVTLDSNGNGSVAFASIETGAIPAGIGALTTIVSTVLGWETVGNLVAATLGAAVQSDISSRRERGETLGAQGSGLAVAIFSKVRAVAGVTSLVFRENFTNAPIVLPAPDAAVALVANSVWVCVDGGSDADVASALLGAKSGGCNWNNGNSSLPVSENVLDPTSNQLYSVLFDRPDLIPVLYEVTIKSSSVSNAIAIVKAAILAYANGELDGEEGLVVGADVSPFEAAGAINTVEPAITVTKLEVTTVAAATLLPQTIFIELFERATVLESSITVIVV